jgi:putative component of membrane protein insertase Oxa1/YidC/SpoIIIJ protein YidD
MTTSVSIAAIEWYQRSISPRKGWQCAHRVRHGGFSCSEWTKRAIRRCGLRNGLLLARRRFARCHAAANEHTAPMENRWEEPGRNKRKNCMADHIPLECCCDGADIVSCIGEAGHALACADLSWLDAGCACLPWF